MTVAAHVGRWLVVALLCGAPAPVTLAHGARLDQIRLDDLSGGSVAPFASSDARTVVLVFVRTDCPISSRYLPELERQRAEFEHDGISFWLVFCDPNESGIAIRAHLASFACDVPALRDPRHELVAAAGASITPEAVVFTRRGTGWRLLYRGRIDDRYSALGSARPAATRNDLEEMLRDVVRGVARKKTTTAIGCAILDLE